MRNAVRIIVASFAATAAVAFYALPSGAGAPVTNTFTVDKQVVGPVPTGTTFTVEVTCVSVLGPAALAPVPTVITFDASGTPTSNNVVNVPAGQRCSANETVNGGATSVTFACAITRGNTDQTPPFLGNCGPADNQATFTDVIGDHATITVTNTFPTPPPTTPPVVQAVQATPVFTG